MSWGTAVLVVVVVLAVATAVSVPEGWLIEPIPGARGWWMRTQFRWFGWWFYRYVWPQAPHLEVSCGLVGVEDGR